MFGRTALLLGKFSPRQAKGLPLTSKIAANGFYKGMNAVKPGLVTRRGGFHFMEDKMLVISVPADMDRFKPYVDNRETKTKQSLKK